MRKPKRYWYHVSQTLTGKEVKLVPRRFGDNRSTDEPPVARVCVAPTIEQCMAAVPYSSWCSFQVYRTKNKVVAEPATDAIPDAPITEEHWVRRKVKYVRVGYLDLKEFRAPKSSASNCGEAKKVRACLAQWQKHGWVDQFLRKKRLKVA